jgi:DNA-binding MarR family transcriptional regulator
MFHNMRSGKRLKPIQTAEQATFINLLQTHRHVLSGLNDLLKGYNLSEPQYNVLRILRGAGPEGLPCQRISERMVTRVPDVTRLIDRLASSGLVTRRRSSADRRIVTVRVTEGGLALLRKLDEPVLEMHKQQFGVLTSMELYELNRLLVTVRRGHPSRQKEETD